MPLIKPTLEQAIKARIKALEPKLKDSLNDKGAGIYSALREIDSKMQTVSTGFNIQQVKIDQWTLVSDEWSTALAKQIIDTLSKELSKIIADELDTYIKSATIITPPGQAVAVGTPSGPGSGSTVSPSGPATIS